MIASAFQLNKVRRLIKVQGHQFTFVRENLNEFREPNGQTVSVIIRGVFHETTSYLAKTSSDAATLRSKSSPMILCTWEEGKNLLHTDRLYLNGNTYTVGGIKNLCEANIIADISLEEVQGHG